MVQQPAAAEAAAPDAAAAPDSPGNTPDMSSSELAALPPAQTCKVPDAAMEKNSGAKGDSISQPTVSEDPVGPHAGHIAAASSPVIAEGALPGAFTGAEAAAGHKETLTSKQPRKARPEPGNSAAESPTDIVRPERDSRQKGQHLHKQRVSSSEDRVEDPPEQSLPSTTESPSQSGGSSMHRGYIAGHLCQTRCSALLILRSMPTSGSCSGHCFCLPQFCL